MLANIISMKNKASRKNQDFHNDKKTSEIIKAIEGMKEIFPDITYQQCKRLETDLAFRQGFVLGISLFEKRTRSILEK